MSEGAELAAGETEVGEGGSAQIRSGCARGKRGLHTAVPSLWMGSSVRMCPVRLPGDSNSLPFILPLIFLYLFFFFFPIAVTKALQKALYNSMAV